jgi:hypothetical protein
VTGRAPRVTWAAETRTFRALDLVFDVRTTDVELASFLDGAFGNLPEADPGDPGRVRFGLAEVRDGDATLHRLYRRGRAVEAWEDAGVALARLTSLINAGVRRAGPHRLFLHAAVVGDGEGTTLLTGGSHAGKTTLAAVLVDGGLAYGSDEMLAIEPGTGALDAFRRPMTLRLESHGLFEGGPVGPRPGLERYASMTWLVTATDLGSIDLDPVPPVRTVVFPTYLPASTTSWEPLTRPEALARLQRESWHLLRHGRGGFRALVDLVAGAQHLGTLRYPDAREAARALDDLAGAHPA